MTDGPAVLLVDDHEENLLALRASLEPLGCRTVSVTSGEQALKALLQDEFAVVLLDVQMPGMDGFETAELIMSRRRTRTVPIIFVTAISKESHHVYRGYDVGAVDYLFKPYDPDLLKSKVRVFLELDDRRRAAARGEALLRATFDSAPIGMARIDPEGRFAEVNHSLAHTLGYEAHELSDRLVASLFHPDDLPDPERRIALLAGVMNVDAFEARLMTATGNEIPFQLNFAVARPPDGATPAIVMEAQDLRLRRQAEADRDGRIREQVARAEAERALESLRALQLISDAAMGTLAPDQLIPDLLNRTADALKADAAAVVLAEPDGTSVVHQCAGGEFGAAAQRWYSVVTAEGDAATNPLGTRMASTLSVPLITNGRAMGAIQVGALFDLEYSDAERTLLALAADRAAQAISRARQHQLDHAITEELQRALLPVELPEIRGAATASRYFPGGAGERVGGDWFDAVQQGDERLLLVIGDVAGHGIGAATEMGQLRSAVRAYALDGYGPADVLSRVNAFHITTRGRGMVTIALVLVDLAERRITYARAGHLPPLLTDARGATRWLDGALGPPVGALDDIVYEEAVTDLEPGATIALYTDGVVERRGELLDRGLARLSAALGSAPDGMDAACDHVLAQTLPEHATEDDVTLLMLRAVGRRPRGRRKQAPQPVPTARQLASGTWPHSPVRSARIALPADPGAGSAVRRVIAETLGDAVTQDQIFDVQTIVTEIVNNAVVHGGSGAVEFLLAAAPDVIRAETLSDGVAFTPPPPSDIDEPGGFGLGIVEHLSTRWGFDFSAGVCVWFEIDRS